MAIAGISLKDYAKTGGKYDASTGRFIDPNGYAYDPATRTWLDPSGAPVEDVQGFTKPWDTGTPQIPGMGGTTRTPAMDVLSAKYKALPPELKAAMTNVASSREPGNFLTHSVLPAAAMFAGGVALGGLGGAGAASASGGASAGGALTTYPLATAPAASALTFTGTGIPAAAAAVPAAAGAGGLGGAGLGGGAAVPAGGANLGGASLGYSPTAAGAPLGGAVKGAGANWRKIIEQTLRQQGDTPAQPNAATGGGGSIGRGLGGQSQWAPDRMRQIMGETVEQAALRRKRREIADAMVLQMATGGSGLGT